MTALSKIDTVEYFKELPFYKKPIEKPKIKRLKNIDRLVELSFYKQLSVTKLNQAFQWYAVSYKVKFIEKKDPIVQLEASKLSIKDLFSVLLNETVNYYAFQSESTLYICLNVKELFFRNRRDI